MFVAGREITALRRKLEAIAADRVDAVRIDGELKAQLARLDTEIMSLEAELSARGDQRVSATG